MARMTRRRSLRDKHLPLEIWTEILARLPVKTLLKFRCVCKSWCSLIDSLDFISLHLQVYNNSKGSENNLLLVYELVVRVAHNFTVRWLDTFKKIATIAQIRDKSCSIHGSCNGLIFLWFSSTSQQEEIRLWNPFIRKSLILPPCPVIGCGSIYSTSYALGFAPSSNDYKVLACKCNRENEEVSVAVYSLNDHLWRIKPNVNVQGWGYSYIGCGRGNIFCGGFLYWIDPVRIDPQRPGVIWEKGTHLLSFDFDVEQFGCMELPDPMKYSAVAGRFVFPLGESLAIFTLSSESSRIWVLEKNGGKDVWSWRLWFSGDSNLDACNLLIPYRYPYSNVLFHQKNYTLLMETKDGVKSYNIMIHRTQSLWKSSLCRFSPGTYGESLALHRTSKGRNLTSFP